MQDSYFGMPQITLQQLNVPVSVLNAFIGAHDNAGAQAALFAGDDVITGGPLDDLFRGYAGNDAISTGAGADTLDGGIGDDTLNGGAGSDVITTGGGADVIVVGQGESAGQADVVTDWNSSDAIRFAHAVGDSTAYVEDTATDLASAATRANQLIGSGAANVVAVAVGNDVVIYADSGADNGVADDVVVLTGRTLADVSSANFGMSAPTTPPTGPDGMDLHGTSAADTLIGGAGNDTLDGGAGGDTIFTGGGADVIVIGQGQSPNGAYGSNDNVMDWSSSDTVRFAHAPTTASEYTEITAGSFAQGTLLVNQLISSGAANVVALAVGGDVAVYADSAGDNGVADDVVFLAGRSLADVSATNFVTGGTTTPPVTPPVVIAPPAAPTGLMLDAASDSGVKGDGITNLSQFHMTGVAEKGASVSLYDGTQLVGTGQADAATGAFSVAASSPLADGAHTLSATAANSGGASVYSASVQVTLDTKAALSDFDAFTETQTGSKQTVALHGTASDATSGVVSVNVLQDGTSIGSVKPVGGEWSVTKTNVSDAVHTYTLQTTDAAGNVGAASSTLILGSSGGDKIVGNATNDVIHGDAGADTLTGGAGADVFVYNALDDAALGKNKTSPLDTITDFQSGADKLDLSDLGHMTFKGQSTTFGAHEVSWYVSSGNTFVTGDVTGDGKADFIIQLKGTLALSGSDFLLA